MTQKVADKQIPKSVTIHEAAEKLAEWLKTHPEDRAALRAALDKEFGPLLEHRNEPKEDK